MEYNFPHRISANEIRERVLKDIEQEQLRLEKEKTSSQQDNQAKEDFEESEETGSKQNLKYENYFGLNDDCKYCLYFICFKKFFCIFENLE